MINITKEITKDLIMRGKDRYRSIDDRFKCWVRVINSVDAEGTNGYAIEGAFLNLGRTEELESGTLIMLYTREGSRKYNNPVVRVYRIAEASLELVLEREDLDDNWFPCIREDLSNIINEKENSSKNNSINKSQLFKRAWEIARQLAKETNQSARNCFSAALKLAWSEAR